MLLLLLPTSGYWYNVLCFVMWLGNLVCSVLGLFISLYMVIVHDDFKRDIMQPVELADTIQKYVPLEYACTLALFCFCQLMQAPFWCFLAFAPLQLYNLSRLAAKEHKTYFITKAEYAKKQDAMS